MQRQLAAFVEQPCKATYLAARDAVLSQSPFPLMAAEMANLDFLLEHEEHQALLDRLDALPASKVLSPRIHFLAAEAAEALGYTSDIELERSLFVLTLQGLLATGDGTRANPYFVCHASDEHDVLAALGHEAAGQSLVAHEGRLCDVLVCSDGREVWFDVTDLLVRKSVRRPHFAKRLRPKRPKLRASRSSR
ncbi:MAG: hypothetical protein JF612_06620 [Planctomycetia bacterium]|jgi:hypothetical protein|nr:hypothetical protein [Planctomycetia bacterium]